MRVTLPVIQEIKPCGNALRVIRRTRPKRPSLRKLRGRDQGFAERGREITSGFA